MSAAISDFIHGQADLGSESDDEDFDEATGEARPRQANGVNGRHFEDSSEEDEDDDDEEEAERVMSRSTPALYSPADLLEDPHRFHCGGRRG